MKLQYLYDVPKKVDLIEVRKSKQKFHDMSLHLLMPFFNVFQRFSILRNSCSKELKKKNSLDTL